MNDETKQGQGHTSTGHTSTDMPHPGPAGPSTLINDLSPQEAARVQQEIQKRAEAGPELGQVRPDAILLSIGIGPQERRQLKRILGGEGEVQIGEVGANRSFVTRGDEPPQTLYTRSDGEGPQRPRYRWFAQSNGWQFGTRIADVP